MARARRAGARVGVVEFDDADLAGSCWYESGLIRVDHRQSTLDLVLVLAHELGHWLSYRALPHRYDRESGCMRHAEELAWIYGWHALSALGLAGLAEALWRERGERMQDAPLAGEARP